MADGEGSVSKPDTFNYGLPHAKATFLQNNILLLTPRSLKAVEDVALSHKG
jgi:hypothetical protein